MNRRNLLLSALALLPAMIGDEALALAHWQYFGADPAYKSRDAAVLDAERVFVTRVGWPRSAAQALVAQMKEGRGAIYRITVGDRFDFMRTGPSGLWRNVVADFKQRPKERGTEFSVRAERFVHVENGVTYEGFIPETCNNLAGRMTGVVRAQKQCAYVLFQARADDAYAIVHILGKPVDTDGCEVSVNGPAPDGGMKFNDSAFEALADKVPSRCPTDTIPAFYELPLQQVGSFEVSPGWYAVKVPLVFADNLDTRVVVCLVKKDGQSTHAMGVRFFEYQLQDSGRKVAVIWYAENDVPQGYRNRTGLWWRWSVQRSFCRN